MSSSRIYLHYLQDIVANITKALEFVEGMSGDDFLQDDKTAFAVIRALEVIGEAAKGVPEEVRDKYPGIPWRNMAGMRDKLIHHYFGVELDTVWKTVTQDLRTLEPKIKDVLRQESM
jgi:uncharacterized protein with HEPN domain